MSTNTKLAEALRVAEHLQYTSEGGLALGPADWAVLKRKIEALASHEESLRDDAEQALKPICIYPACQHNGCTHTRKQRAVPMMPEQAAKAVPAGWKHDCAGLLTNDLELWIDRCPHCGKPAPHAPTPPAPEAQQAAGQEQDERVAFEAWAKEQRHGRISGEDDWDMDYPLGRCLWTAWQARAALAQRPDSAPAADWERELSAVMPQDFKDWWQNSRREWPSVAAAVIRSQRADRDLGWEMAAKAAPAAEPLTDEQIESIRAQVFAKALQRCDGCDDETWDHWFARAIERAHGIVASGGEVRHG